MEKIVCSSGKFFAKLIFTVFAITFVLCLFVNAYGFDLNGEQGIATTSKASSDNNPYEEIKTITAKLSPCGEACEVTVSGRPFDTDSPYFTNIMLTAHTSPQIVFSPPVDTGYTVDIVPLDFLGKGYDQIFYAAASGGSGGFGYYYIFDLSTGKVKTLFDFEDFANIFTAEYSDNFTAKIFKAGQPFISFDLSNRDDLKYLWNSNGEFIGDAQPDVSPLNFVEPAYLYSAERYRLNVWQKVTLSSQADVAGYLITSMDFCEKDNFISILSTHHPAYPLNCPDPIPTPYSENKKCHMQCRM